MSWVDDYVSFLNTERTRCCQFFEKNFSTCYSEDYYNHDKKSVNSVLTSFIGDHEDNSNDFTTQTSSTSKVQHKEHLPNDVFENYDDYYYYEDGSETSTRSKRSLAKKWSCKGRPESKCCRYNAVML